jgi:hypothetical protein
MTRVLVAFLVIVAIGGAPGSVGAAGCVKKKGQLMSRDACRKSERPLDTTTLSPVGPTGTDGARGEAGTFPLAIVDAANREVGPVLTFDFTTAVVVVTHPVLPSPLPFAVAPIGFVNLGDDAYASILYAEIGCAGQPYVADELGDYVHVEGTAAYRASGTAASIAVASIESDDLLGCPAPNLTNRATCCTTQTFTQDAVPTVRFAIADLGFTTPFRVVPR